MNTVQIHGIPVSSYVRTARMAAAAKGVAHELVPVEFGADSHRALHPFTKVPAMTHGDVTLYETIAIVDYFDRMFEGGAKLFPSDDLAHVRTMEFISVATSYLYPACIGDLVLHYLFPKGEGGTPDRKAIDAAIPKVKHGLAVVDAALKDREWLAGPFSAADLFVSAIVVSIGATPEKTLLADAPNLQRLVDGVAKRPAGEFLVPKT